MTGGAGAALGFLHARICIVAAIVLPSRLSSDVFPRRLGAAAQSTAAPHGALLNAYVPGNCIGPPSVASLSLLRPNPPLQLRFVYGLASQAWRLSLWLCSVL